MKKSADLILSSSREPLGDQAKGVRLEVVPTSNFSLRILVLKCSLAKLLGSL